MGVYHFMGLGRAVGAVTCAVDYIEKALDSLDRQPTEETRKLFSGSGGIAHEEQEKGKIEAIVLFTSKEVIDGSLQAFSYKGCSQPGSVHEEIVKTLKKTWRSYNQHEGRKIFWCEVDIDDFQDCFDKIIRTTYRFSASGKQGKEIWCNLTGGSNSIGFALLSMARLTGKSTKHYLISQRKDYREEVTVPSTIRSICPNKDDYFHVVPFLKTDVDLQGFYEILLELDEVNTAVTTRELFGRLRNKQFFLNIELEEFIRQHLLKLYGLGYTAYDPETKVCHITDPGRNFINENLEPFFALREELDSGTRNMLEESKNWTWLTEENLY